MSLIISSRYLGAAVSDPDAQAYLRAVETADNQPLEFLAALAVNEFVIGCKADNIWSAIKASCILAGARTLNGALVPLVGAAPTNINFAAGDYNRKTGLIGNASAKYLDSNRNNNADLQNSKHMAVFINSAHTTTAAASYMGAGRSSIGASNMGASAIGENAFFSRMNCVAASGTILQRTHTGFAAVNRISSAEYTRRLSPNSTVITQASQAPFNGNYFIFAENNSGTPSEPANARLSFYSIGESLNLALLDARVTALMAALAAAIP